MAMKSWFDMNWWKDKIWGASKELVNEATGSFIAGEFKELIKGSSNDSVQAIQQIDQFAKEGKFQEAYSSLKAFWSNWGDRDEEILLQDILVIKKRVDKFASIGLSESDILSSVRLLARMPKEFRDNFRHAHMTELDNRKRQEKLANWMALKGNSARKSALASVGLMDKSLATQVFESVLEFDQLFVRPNKRLKQRYNRKVREMKDENARRKNRTFWQWLWDIVKPYPLF